MIIVNVKMLVIYVLLVFLIMDTIKILKLTPVNLVQLLMEMILNIVIDVLITKI